MAQNQAPALAPIHITIDDPTVAPLIDGYLGRRRVELQQIREALDALDFRSLRLIGHNLHGSGGAYGLDRLSELGAALERDASDADAGGIRRALAAIEDFLDRLVIG